MQNTRMTTQRLKILEYLQSVKTHPTADDIYNVVKKDMPTITLATVYRNLNLLAEHNQIRRITINGEYHFDATNDCHIHCVCKACGKITDICGDCFEDEISSKIKKTGFFPENISIITKGKCKECKDEKN